MATRTTLKVPSKAAAAQAAAKPPPKASPKTGVKTTPKASPKAAATARANLTSMDNDPAMRRSPPARAAAKAAAGKAGSAAKAAPGNKTVNAESSHSDSGPLAQDISKGNSVAGKPAQKTSAETQAPLAAGKARGPRMPPSTTMVTDTPPADPEKAPRSKPEAKPTARPASKPAAKAQAASPAMSDTAPTAEVPRAAAPTSYTPAGLAPDHPSFGKLDAGIASERAAPPPDTDQAHTPALTTAFSTAGVVPSDKLPTEGADAPNTSAEVSGPAGSAEDRRRRIAESAYYRAERAGFPPGSDLTHWLEAEKEHEGK